MVSALASGIEKLRLSTLHRYGILDTDREDAFDELAKLAATACGTPAAWIAFVNGDRLWFKSTFGFERREIPRAHALCEDALTQPDVFVVRDTLSEASYADSPLVRGAPRARFYAAAPLVTPDGYALGAIAVADHAPRELEPAQADALRALARQIVTLLEARLAETLNRRALELSSDIIYMTDDGGHFTFVNPVATRILGYELPELLGKHYLELIRPDFREAVAEFYSKQSELRENSTYFEFPAVAKDGTEVWFGQNVQIVTDGRKVTGFHAVARDITARRQAQDALRRSEERLRQALLSTNGGIWEYCLGSQKFTWSDDFYRLLGMEPGEREPSVESWLERVHPDDRAWVRETAATSLSESGELDIEYRVVLAGGRVRWLNVKGKAVRNGAAGAARYAGIAIDITARKAAEEEARRASEYANLFRYANDAILVLDPETGRILDANEKACESYGHDLHGLVGASLDAISTSPVEELRLFAEHAPRGESFEFEADHRAGGRVIHLLVSASFIDYHGGRALLCICRDITARKEAEERLRVSEARYRQLIEQASDGIVLFTADGTILESNNRICEITGRTCDDLVGTNVADYLNREDLLAEPIHYRELLSGDTLLTNRRVVRADGTLVPVEVTARVLTGEKKVILAIVRDVTERRRAEEMLRRSEEHLFKAQRMEAIGQLAGGVAHDFNNILTGVFGFTDLALRQVETLEAGGETEATGRLRRNLEEVKDAGQRGAGLTKQLLAFSRQQQLAQRTIDINQTITSLLGLLRRLIEENVTVHFYPGADRSTVSADAGQIEQVLLNLAANARDAMPTGGQLIIETANVTLDDAYVERHPYARAGRYLLIRVSDTGTGMPEHVRSRIFEPFFTTKDVDKGTGLGLSTAYGIVKQHNGTVEVYSEPGHGTTFKIYLPLESGPAEKVVEPERPRLVGGAETVLVVEDDPSLERLARQHLEELGYRVVCAQNGRDAVKVYEARHRDIDLILLDVIMPGLDGPEALREMRELVPDTAPVVFMTGYSPEVVRARLEEELNAGAGLLPKPYTLAEIGAKVREALDARRGGGRKGGG